MTDAQQRAAAKAFAKNWKDRGYEKGDSQIFWVELLTMVFGVTEISQFISFEDQVHLDHTSFIDGYIEKTHVMIEQKSINKSLTAAIRQSDGSMLTPFEQAKRYSSELPYSKRPRWIVTSNFQSFIFMTWKSRAVIRRLSSWRIWKKNIIGYSSLWTRETQIFREKWKFHCRR